jgi:pilus assembly protein Flp/PilA
MGPNEPAGPSAISRAGSTLIRVSKGVKMYARLMRILNSEKGASLVEYSLLVLLIAIAVLTAVALFGDELSSTYSDISSNLVDAGS